MYKNEKSVLDYEVEFLLKQRKYKEKHYCLMNTTNDSDRKEKLEGELQTLLADNLELFLNLKHAELEKKFNDDNEKDFRRLVVEKFEEEKNKTTS